MGWNQRVGPPPGTAGAEAEAAARRAAAATGDSDTPSGLELILPQLQTGLDSDQLRDLAFHLCVACLGSSAASSPSPSERQLLDVLRRQLEVDEGRAADTMRLVQRVGGSGRLRGGG